MTFKNGNGDVLAKEIVRQAMLEVQVKAGITFLKNISSKYFIVSDPIIFPKE